MVQALLTQADQASEFKLTLSASQLPDVTRIAENALIQALEVCVKELDLDGIPALARRIKRGDTVACAYYRHGLAKQVAQSLGALEANVKGVYLLDEQMLLVGLASGDENQDAPRIRLLVWMEPVTSTFGPLVAALDRALVQGYLDVLGTEDVMTLLDVQVIDDADVQKLIGYGAFLVSVHQRLEQFWEHQE
jgi:hypothetical protein